jgi:hypothetical protein
LRFWQLTITAEATAAPSGVETSFLRQIATTIKSVPDGVALLWARGRCLCDGLPAYSAMEGFDLIRDALEPMLHCSAAKQGDLAWLKQLHVCFLSEPARPHATHPHHRSLWTAEPRI